MILENDKEISKAALDKLIEKTLKTFPQFKKDKMVMLKYAPHLYQDVPHSDPPRKSCPRSIPLPLLNMATTETGTKSYRYATTAIPSSDGGPITYRPPNLVVDQQIPITDIELLVYLHHFCPWVKDCENPKNDIVPTLEIEDTRRDSVLRMDSKKIEKEYLTLLLETKIELLKSIATSYNINIDEDEDDINIVQGKISDYIGESQTKKVALIEAINGQEELKETFNALDKLKEAEKLGIVAYESMKKQWELIPVGGVPVKLLSTKTAKITALYQHLVKTNEDALKAIINEVDARGGAEGGEGEK